MKSSPSIVTANRQLSPWNPAELTRHVDTPLNTEQQELIRKFFQGQAGRKVRPSALYRADDGHSFTTWTPGDMKSRNPAMRAPEWALIEPEAPAEDPQARPAIGEETAPESGSAPGETHHQPKPGPVDAAVAARAQALIDLDDEVARILSEARLQAEEILLNAQAEADKLVTQAQDEIEDQKRDGFNQGWENASSELRDTLRAMMTVYDDVRIWKDELIAQGEPVLIGMLKEMAQKMFGDGVELDTSALQMNLNRIMENAQGLGNLNIFLNPRDAKNLDPSWSEYQMLITGTKVRVIPSGRIKRGGCFIKGEMGVIDGRVETQMDAILKMLDETSEASE